MVTSVIGSDFDPDSLVNGYDMAYGADFSESGDYSKMFVLFLPNDSSFNSGMVEGFSDTIQNLPHRYEQWNKPSK